MLNEFQNIDSSNEKIDRIINSALKIFSENNFDKASTNLVIQDAGISRGLLYHYFKDKQQLFDFLLEFTYDVISVHMSNDIDWDSNDLFERFSQIMRVKLETHDKYPYIFDFFDRCGRKKGLQDFSKLKTEGMHSIKSDFYKTSIDYTKFKDGIDVEKVVSVSRYVVTGILTKEFSIGKITNKQVNTDEIMSKIDDYLDFLREQFYK